ncbi:hypothetical protein QSH57_004379 [Fusarium oxysporum f. sp. vasinfectum]|nr:hypothetical protein QSH57_004379 [Fusarium oxysporum f. sp. vasinfectum]
MLLADQSHYTHDMVFDGLRQITEIDSSDASSNAASSFEPPVDETETQPSMTVSPGLGDIHRNMSDDGSGTHVSGGSLAAKDLSSQNDPVLPSYSRTSTSPPGLNLVGSSQPPPQDRGDSQSYEISTGTYLDQIPDNLDGHDFDMSMVFDSEEWQDIPSIV